MGYAIAFVAGLALAKSTKVRRVGLYALAVVGGLALLALALGGAL